LKHTSGAIRIPALKKLHRVVMQQLARRGGVHLYRVFQRRLEGARRELEFAPLYDYQVINDDFDKALAELRAAGYITQRKVQTKAGRWCTENYVYERPLSTDAVDNTPTETRLPKLGPPKLGKPTLIPKTETKDLDQPPNPPDVIDRVLDKAAERIVKHREEHGYGRGGPGALSAARSNLDVVLAKDWLQRGAEEHRVVVSLASRVLEPDLYSTPL